MDSITQTLLGITIAQAGFRHRLGKSALYFAALCATLPDADVLLHEARSIEALQSHRGYSHSLVILPTIAPLLGGIAWSIDKLVRKKECGPFRVWTHLAFWALVTHPLLDFCTAYGTQLFLPFTNHRYSTDAIAIVDFLYTLPLFLATVWAFGKDGRQHRYKRFAQGALLVSTSYLIMGHVFSEYAIRKARAQFSQIGFKPIRIRSNPPIFFSPLRRVVAIDSQKNLMTATYSLFSTRPPVPLLKKQSTDPLVEKALQQENTKIFAWFADDFLLVERLPDELRISDARYGVFTDPWKSPFVLSAPIQPDGTLGVLQLEKSRGNIRPLLELRAGWKKMLGKE